MNKILFIWCISGCLAAASAQGDQYIEKLTALMVENTDAPGTVQIQETIDDLLQSPINLNSASEKQLSKCGIFSPYQVYGIIRYREEMGAFYSVYELVTIPGFRMDFLELISSLVTFPVTDEDSFKKEFSGIFLSNIKRNFPGSRAYFYTDSTSPAYPGSPSRLSSRIKIDAGGKMVFGLAYEKDAGETSFTNWWPEHLSGYIDYQPGKVLDHLIIGNFRIHTGMGLVHGMGFNSSGSGASLKGFRTNYARGFASTAEYSYYRGILTKWSAKKWSSTLFYSFKPEDISLFGMNDPAAAYDLFDAKRETGLHRTGGELDGRDLAFQHTGGISLDREQLHFNCGLSAVTGRMVPTGRLLDSVPFIRNAKNGRWNISVYAIGFGKKYEYFAEYAINEMLSGALLIGINFELNPALSFYSSFRNYQAGYNGQVPGAYSPGARISDETGLNTGLTLIPFDDANLHFDYDICQHPDGNLYPSISASNMRSRAEFTYEFPFGMALGIKYSYRYWQEDDPGLVPGPGITTPGRKDQWRIHYTYPLSESMTLSGRIERANSDTEQAGLLAYQQVRLGIEDLLTLTYRILFFNIDSWDNRIYCYEPGVRYSFLFPAYNGNGTKNSMVITAEITRWITCRVWLAYTHYANRWETGSGTDIRIGDQQVDAELQLQLKF